MKLEKLEIDPDIAQVEPAPAPPPAGPAVPRAPSRESARIRDLALAGKSPVEISREVGLGVDTVNGRLRTMGVKWQQWVADGRMKVPEKYRWMEKYEKQQGR